MTRARKTVDIIEGFKLGSLGAGKIKLAKEPENPRPSLIEVIVKSRGSLSKLPSIAWEETIDPRDLQLGHFVSEDFPVLFCDMFVPSHKWYIFLRYYNPIVEKTGEKRSRNHGYFELEIPSDLDFEKAKKFVQGFVKRAAKGGLRGIGFPRGEAWKRHQT
jgi:hypothetical protein